MEAARFCIGQVTRANHLKGPHIRACLCRGANGDIAGLAVGGANAPAFLDCVKTVSESHLFQPKGLPFEREQIPQIVVIVRIQR
jgi:hypothetical protein